MNIKDISRLEEAYISATQKAVNVLPSMPQPDVDQEVLPVILTPTNEPNYPEDEEEEVSGSCGCEGSLEESEEDSMSKVNLFSIFSNAKKIHQHCLDGISLDPWMHQKLAVCADSLESIFRSVNYEASSRGSSCD
jgi:hypothetical protein